jgi:LysR family cyn operon transcriptional activator
VAVADSQSYTRGGATLQLAQPTVHQHVRQLERITRTRLVDQVGKRVVLTSHGRLLYEYAGRIATISDELERALDDDVSLENGDLALAAGTTAGEFVIPRICTSFTQRYSGVRATVAVINDIVAIDRGVASRQYELGFHSDPRPEEGVVKEPLLEESLVGIAPVAHPFSGRTVPVRPIEISGQAFLAFEGNNPPVPARSGARAAIRHVIDEWLEREQAVPQIVFSSTSLEAIKTAARAGAGIAIVSRASIRPGDTSLAKFELQDPPRRSFFLVRRQSGWESAAHRAFVNFALSDEWRDEET